MGKKNTRPAQAVSKDTGGFALPTSPVAYWRMFAERWWLGVPFAILFGIGIGYYLMMPKPPSYTTQASINFERRGEVGVGAGSGGRSLDPLEMNNHVEKLQSTRFINYMTAFFTNEEKALVQKGFEEVDQPDKPLPSPASIIRRGMGFTWRENTTILDIRYSHRDPNAARFIADTIANKYIAFDSETDTAETNSVILKLKRLEREWRKKVEDSNQELIAFSKTHNISRLDERQNVVYQREQSIKTQLVKLQNDTLDLQTQLRDLNARKANGEELHNIPFIASYGRVSSLSAELERLRVDQIFLNERYLENHPKVKESNMLLAEKQRQFEEEIALAIVALGETLDRTEVLEREYSAELLKVKESARELDDISQDLELMKRQHQEYYNNLQAIIRRIDQEMIKERTDRISITLFESAYSPGPAPTMTLPKAIAQASAVGIFFWLAVPIGIGLLDTRIKSSTDLEDSFGLPILATIPRMRRMETDSKANAVKRSLDDAISESFRALYSQMSLVSRIQSPKRILFTSTVPNEGKSLIANNVGATFAMHGKKVLMVDCDFRRPTLNYFYKEANTKGLLKWIISEPAENLPLRDNPYLGIVNISTNLDLLRSGGRIKNPTEYITMLERANIWQRLSQEYDIVILDTPPVGVFPDALLLAEQVDEVVYVCRYNAVKKFGVKKTLKHFRMIDREPLGFVLNDVPNSLMESYEYAGYSSYQSKYYKSYAKSAAKA